MLSDRRREAGASPRRAEMHRVSPTLRKREFHLGPECGVPEAARWPVFGGKNRSPTPTSSVRLAIIRESANRLSVAACSAVIGEAAGLAAPERSPVETPALCGGAAR